MAEKQYGKYIGWGIALQNYGQLNVRIVPAKTKKEAIIKLRSLGHIIANENHVHRICIIKHPGPQDVRKMKTMNWKALMKQIYIYKD